MRTATDRLLRAGTIATTLTTGLSAGFFSTYQWSVTRGLARVDDAVYVRAFQEINATVRTPWFAVVFFGAGLFGLLTCLLAGAGGAPRAVTPSLAPPPRSTWAAWWS